MDNKRYTLEEKIKFLDALEKKGTVASAARCMGIHNDDVCYRWARKKDELRAAYSLSLKPGRPVKQVRRRGSKIPLQDKIQCIMAIDGGMSIHRASVEFNKNLASVQSWYRSKEDLLALYYSQQKACVEKQYRYQLRNPHRPQEALNGASSAWFRENRYRVPCPQNPQQRF